MSGKNPYKYLQPCDLGECESLSAIDQPLKEGIKFNTDNFKCFIMKTSK